MVNTVSRPSLCVETALELLSYYNQTHHNISYDDATDRLTVRGLVPREAALIELCLNTLGAHPENFAKDEMEFGCVILTNAKSIAQKLTSAEINISGARNLGGDQRLRS